MLSKVKEISNPVKSIIINSTNNENMAKNRKLARKGFRENRFNKIF